MSTIQIKRGSGTSVPSSLADGELAINLDNGKLYFGSGSAVINSFRFENLTAENYIVSSSVTNVTFQQQSGSTIFGDSEDDNHAFSGSITASSNISSSGTIIGGGLDINGTTTFNEGNITNVGIIDVDQIRADGDSDVTIQLDSAGYSFNLGEKDKDFKYFDSDEDALIHGDAGLSRVGISDTSPSSKLDVGGDLNVQSHITASGNISASGTITTNNLTVDTILNLGSMNFSAASDENIIGVLKEVRFDGGGKLHGRSDGNVEFVNSTNGTFDRGFVTSDITASQNVTASKVIVDESSGGFFIGSNIGDVLSVSSNDLRINHGGQATSIGIGRGNTTVPVTLFGSLTVKNPAGALTNTGLDVQGHTTSSGNISSSAAVVAATGSFTELHGNGTATTGLEVTGSVSATTGSFDVSTKSPIMETVSYAITANHTSELYIPIGGSTADSTGAGYLSKFACPHDGVVKRICLYFGSSDPGDDVTVRVRKDTGNDGQVTANEDIVQTITRGGLVDDTIYHFDFSASFSKGDTLAFTQQTPNMPTSTQFIHGTIMFELDTST